MQYGIQKPSVYDFFKYCSNCVKSNLKFTILTLCNTKCLPFVHFFVCRTPFLKSRSNCPNERATLIKSLWAMRTKQRNAQKFEII